MTYGTSEIDERTGWRGFLVPFGVILGLAGLLIGLWFLIDDQASANVAAWLYDLIGDTAEADALRAGSGNRNVAKVILAAVAMFVGVGGIWLFYAGLNMVVMRLSARWRGQPAAVGLRRARARYCSRSTWSGRSWPPSSSPSPTEPASATGNGP